MCQNSASPFIVGMSKTERKAIIVKANCDKWECEECANNKRLAWCARAILGCKRIRSNGFTPKFITVTMRPQYVDFAACHAAFQPAWERLYARMKRKKHDLMYLLTLEKHEKGERLHAHFLTDLQVSTRWMKDNAYKSNLGFMAKVKSVETDGKAAAYVSKYLGKQLGVERLPSNFRRIRCSQNWTALEKRDGRSSDFDWLVCSSPSSLWAATEQCQREKRDMIDVSTGEYFDYSSSVESWVSNF